MLKLLHRRKENKYYIYVYKMYIYIYIYAIMKIMCSSGYHHSSFVATHAIGHMMYGYAKCMNCHKGIAVITWRAH